MKYVVTRALLISSGVPVILAAGTVTRLLNRASLK